MKINTNLAAINTNRAYNRNAGGLSTTIQRLSSGLRINSAKDDAAGLAISERFTSQIRGNAVGMRNAADAVSMLQTAEGGLQEISTMIQRMRELAVQAANTAVIGASERRHLQKEVSQLTSEITRIAKETNFNGVNILNDGAMFGAAAAGDKATVVQALASAWLRESEDLVSTYYGMNASGAKLTVDLDSFTDGAGGTGARVSYAGANATDLTLEIDMADFTDVEFPGDATSASNTTYDSLIAHEMVHAVLGNYTDATAASIPSWFNEGIAELIRGADGRVQSHGGVAGTYGSVDLKTAWGGSSEEYAGAFLTARYLHDQAGGYDDTNVKASGIGQVLEEYNTNGYDLLAAINTATGNGYASLDAFLDDAEANTVISGAVTEASLTNDDTGAIGGLDAEGTSYRDTSPAGIVPDTNLFEKNPTNFNVIFPFDPENDITSGYAQTITFQVGANEGDTLRIGLASATAKALNIDKVDLVTDATAALSYFDTAIDVVAKQRARLGAQMNRVESAIRTSETTVENLSASRSRIVDADYAQETAKLTRTQILAQAGTAMQAQAQATSNLALNLLNGL
ncbi:MAG: flagellinolysin [Gammaproteobacteria bacterium]|nr:flagellinolysin [Gammaproteobacteria bacterium]